MLQEMEYQRGYLAEYETLRLIVATTVSTL